MAARLGGASDRAGSELEKARQYELIDVFYSFDDYQKDVTREEFCKIAEAVCLESGITLYANGHMESRLTDVTQYQNAEAVNMYCMGIVPSVTESEFRPSGAVTREDVAVFLQNLFDYVHLGAFRGNYTEGYRFADDGDISDAARGSVYNMYSQGVLSGDDGDMFRPKENMTAEECVVTLTRLYEIIRDCYENAEDLVYNQLETLQRKADNGDALWRLDPAETVKEYVRGQGLEARISYPPDIFGNECVVTYSLNPHDGKLYTAELFRPIKQDAGGVWAVRRAYRSDVQTYPIEFIPTE